MQTPDRNEEISKRLWDSRVSTWKSQIHLWDNGDPIAALAAADLADAQMGVVSTTTSRGGGGASPAVAASPEDASLMPAPSVRRPKSRIIVPTPVDTTSTAAATTSTTE